MVEPHLDRRRIGSWNPLPHIRRQWSEALLQQTDKGFGFAQSFALGPPSASYRFFQVSPRFASIDRISINSPGTAMDVS